MGILRTLACACVLASCGGNSQVFVFVDLVTDVVPRVEFDEAVVELRVSNAVLDTRTLSASEGDWTRSVRAGRFALRAGTLFEVRAELRRRGEALVSRRAVGSADGPAGVTLVLTRSCVGVVCDEGGTCAGGTCVEPACVSGTEPQCPQQLGCDADEACPAAADSCARSSCEARVCLEVARPGSCAQGSACVPDEGCVAIPGDPPDAAVIARPRDAGVDAFTPPDAFMVDAGVDAFTPADALVALDAPADASGSVGAPGNFDTDLEGWMPYGGDFIDTPEVILPPNATDPATWGGFYDEYWTPDFGDGDRCIGLYISSPGNIALWEKRFTNDTGAAIASVVVEYDLEAHFVRHQGADPGAANYEVRQGILRWGVNEARSSPETTGLNENVTEAHRARWLTDAESDALGLSRRGLSARFEGLDISPGGAFEIRFEHVQGAWETGANVNLCVDNLTIRFEP